MQKIGRKLRHAREVRDESIAEAAKLCYLSPAMIRWIEEDDYGQFPGLPYARSALLRYGNHVRVDVDDAAEELRDHDVAKEAQGAYTWGSTRRRAPLLASLIKRWKRLKKLRGRALINQPKSARRRIPLLLNVTILLAVALLIALFWIGYRVDAPMAVLENLQGKTTVTRESASDE